MHWTVTNYNCYMYGASAYWGNCECECRSSDTGRIITLRDEAPDTSLWEATLNYWGNNGCQDGIESQNFNHSKCEPVCNNMCKQLGHTRTPGTLNKIKQFPNRLRPSSPMGGYKQGGRITKGRFAGRTQNNSSGKPKGRG